MRPESAPHPEAYLKEYVMKILGIHDGHNASACLLQDGRITHLLQEERLTGVKNQSGFPSQAVAWIMESAGIETGELDRVVLGQNSRTTPCTREEIVQSYTRQGNSPPYLRHYFFQARHALLKKLGIYEKVKKKYHPARFADTVTALPGLPRARIDALDHHSAHAASAYYSSPWPGEDALVLTLDGSGDGACATVSEARGGRIRRIARTPSGHSLGDIYARLTHLMGMVPLEHEYKLMGMAPYAPAEKAEEASRIFENYLSVDGLVFRRAYFEPTQFISRRLHRDLKYVRFDLRAAGLQRFFEKRVAEWVGNAVRHTGLKRVCLGGGAFMNVKANGLIAQMDEVEEIFVCPSCGDESLSLGAVQLAYAEANQFKNLPQPPANLYLGIDVVKTEIDAAVAEANGIECETPEDPEQRVAELLADGQIVARCAGRAEFGARALCNRSILADPRNPHALRILNHMIKRRDFWMPFAPALSAHRQDRYLLNPKGLPSPFMMLAFPTREERLEEMICAVHPADRTARPQVLEQGQNPSVEKLLERFEILTGRSVLLNTSLNIHGEPMVGSARQAVSVLLRSGLKWLWLGDRIIQKTNPGNTGDPGV
jgi:carbamoyltransferase